MEKRVYSVFNIDGYYGDSDVTILPEKLEIAVSNEFDVKRFRKSLEEHQRLNQTLHKTITISSESTDEFNTIIKRICERGRRLKPFNTGLIRVLKYGETKWMGISPLRKMLTKGIEGYTTEQLIERYCGFFEEQAVDFGDIFFHVVERENILVNYSNDLVRKDIFYISKRDLIDRMISKIENENGIAADESLPGNTRKALVDRDAIKRNETAESMKVIDTLMKENGTAIREVGGLLRWCSGMKNVLALAKERMDNYATHLSQTLTVYMQATSLQRGFRETNNAIFGLVDVITMAQKTADGGLNDVIDFVRSNGIYSRPIENFKAV